MPKIPVWVWVLAGVAVVILALLAKRSSGSSGSSTPVIVSNPPSDAAVAAASTSEQNATSVRGAAFSSLVNAVAGVSTAGVSAGRDVAVANIGAGVATFQDAVNAQTAQSGQAYSYYGQLAQQNGDTSRAVIAANADVNKTSITANLARILGLADAANTARNIDATAALGAYTSSQETARLLDTNRTTLATTTDTNRTQFSIAQITQNAGVQESANAIAAASASRPAAPHWYDYLAQGVAAALPFAFL